MGADDDKTEDNASKATTDERGGRSSRLSSGTIAGQRYVLGESIGRGGMGEVLAARDEQIGRDVAIKRIRDEEPSERTVVRFLREARIQGRLEHPAIPPVHELGRDGTGLPYFVMKKLAGTTLREILDAPTPSFTRQRLLRAFTEVCLAIEFAHVHGVIHRDIKPGNIMLGEFGEVYVLDWGVAKVHGEADDFDDLQSDGLATRTGAVIGTAGYMAPEQARGDADIDPRADVYALGCVLDEILDRDGGAPPELEELKKKAVALDRDVRIATARALGETVQRFLDGDRDLALRRDLAREHLGRATAALAGGDDEGQRQTAMREAGRALALDPAMDEAAEVVGRLMLEPPRTLPAEVEAAVAADAGRIYRENSRSGMMSYAFFVLLIPSWLMGSRTSEVLAVLGALALNLAVAGWIVKRQTVFPPWLLSLVGASLLLVVTALYTPLFSVGLAVVQAMRLVLNPYIDGARGTVLLAFTAMFSVLFPLAASLIGWLPPMFEVTENGVRVFALGLENPGVLITFVLVLPVGLVTAATVIGHRVRTLQTAASRQLHLQAWHLRQLMPRARPA